MGKLNSAKLHNGAKVVSPGTPLVVTDIDAITIAITGSPTSFAMQFEGSLDGVTFQPIEATKKSNSATAAVTTSVTNEQWEIDTEHEMLFRCNITSITPGAGSLTVVANYTV